ncbi:MAG: saccharopine dehydrogenase NADP-binding domain-containing protein [Candidatus Aminicenantes bacterium]|nr:saccharopine dehydrogenase NADP-binding domain-containing protein [Candidatus Aminicenantes bacterium]
MKIIILGLGLMGKAMALDLLADKKFEISGVDLRIEPLRELREKGLALGIQEDLENQEALKKIVESYDLIINAVPGNLGFKVLKTCVEEGRNVVDITFFPEDPFELEDLAQKKSLTVLVDCGVAPGLSHLLAAHALTRMDKGDSLEIYVGGLPVVRTWPLEYKTVFSPSDVIEEYIRPARCKENGLIKIKPALSEPEMVEVNGLGTLEAFNTDGLRTLLRTLPFPNMKEKTLRYPGHSQKILLLKQAGFFDTQPIIINDQKIIPQEITSKILFTRLRLQPGEEDITVMRVVAKGEKDGQPISFQFDLFDRFDPETGIHSMARTTGFTATMIVRAMAEGLIKLKGIIPPEYLGLNDKCFHFILQGLKDRKIKIKMTSSLDQKTTA